MNDRFLYALCGLLAAGTPASPQQTGWKDLSPHARRFVTVEDGVNLEVLDWGGSGPALVLLAGLGGTAHYYDDFAPALTARYRVVGVTRRGHRGSSGAPSGYGFVRLAEDVLRVIEAVGVNKPVVIGHSFAGEEMHVLGARHSAKIRGLMYVDAAFDRGDDADNEAFSAVARTVPAAPSPRPVNLASFTALRAYVEKYGGAGPEASLRTRYRTNADGSIGGLWAPDLPIRQAMAKEIQAAYRPYKPPSSASRISKITSMRSGYLRPPARETPAPRFGFETSESGTQRAVSMSSPSRFVNLNRIFFALCPLGKRTLGERENRF